MLRPNLSELYGLCLDISNITAKEELDNKRSFTPLHGGPKESNRFISNTEQCIVDDLGNNLNAGFDQFEKSLILK